jgi:acetolactate synthase I/II/III large subunit
MRVADYIALDLTRRGITHGFGIVGGGNIHLWDALAPRIKLVSVHHEQAAAMAATAYYRVCGRLAVCLVTTGAGSANALTGVLAAYMDSIPLLVISGNEASHHLAQDLRVKGVQGYRSDLLVKPCTKAAFTTTRIEDTVWLLEHVIGIALRPREGPVWLDVPKDVQAIQGYAVPKAPA